MRLWHQDLIIFLPRQQLLGQHREAAALRGNGWARKHRTVDYVFKYSPYKLFQYHELIMDEMERRGYRPNISWRRPEYRGEKCKPYKVEEVVKISSTSPIYEEHNEGYLKECLDNLKRKGIHIAM